MSPVDYYSPYKIFKNKSIRNQNIIIIARNARGRKLVWQNWEQETERSEPTDARNNEVDYSRTVQNIQEQIDKNIIIIAQRTAVNYSDKQQACWRNTEVEFKNLQFKSTRVLKRTIKFRA